MRKAVLIPAAIIGLLAVSIAFVVAWAVDKSPVQDK